VCPAEYAIQIEEFGRKTKKDCIGKVRLCRLQIQLFHKDTKVEGERSNQPLHCGKKFTEGRNLTWIPVNI
jgi:hypothetical protein